MHQTAVATSVMQLHCTGISTSVEPMHVLRQKFSNFPPSDSSHRWPKRSIQNSWFEWQLFFKKKKMNYLFILCIYLFSCLFIYLFIATDYWLSITCCLFFHWIFSDNTFPYPVMYLSVLYSIKTQVEIIHFHENCVLICAFVRPCARALVCSLCACACHWNIKEPLGDYNCISPVAWYQQNKYINKCRWQVTPPCAFQRKRI